MFKEKDRVLCERRDIERCLEFHKLLKQRFAKELADDTRKSVDGDKTSEDEARSFQRAGPDH